MRAVYLFESDWRPWSTSETRDRFRRALDRGFDSIMTETDVPTPRMVELCHAAGLKWIAAFPCFSDHLRGDRINDQYPEFAPVNRGGEVRRKLEWYRGLSPASSELRAVRADAALDLVSRSDIDALVLDFVRWPMHWEIEIRPGERRDPGSFDAIALEAFRKRSGGVLPARSRSGAWIDAHVAAQWDAYRCETISGFVAEVANRARTIREVRVGATLVPLPPAELPEAVGQDVAAISKSVDWVLPMLYHAMVRRPPSWVAETAQLFERVAPGQVIPILQVDADRGAEFGADWGAPISREDIDAVSEGALAAVSSQSAVLFPGAGLIDSSPRRGA